MLLTALPLGYISLLLYIRLGSQRVSPKRIAWVIAEVWGVFALIFAIFAVVSQRLGAVPRSSLANELTYQIAHFHTLPVSEQALIGTALLLTLGLFGHLVYSLQRAQRSHPPNL